MGRFDPVRRNRVLKKLAELQPVTLKELTKSLNEDYTFVVRVMKEIRKDDLAHISGWEIHYSMRTALWSAGGGLDAKRPKAKSKSMSFMRTYAREYYHRVRKQRISSTSHQWLGLNI